MLITERIRKIVWFILKLAIAGAIVGYLLLRDPGRIVASFREFDLIWLVPALAVYCLHMVVCAWRWWRLARILDVELPFREAVFLTFQGYFFSLVIPGGAIGGDVVKMGMISKRSKSGNKMEGAFTVLMDRIVGMIALFALALCLLAPASKFLCRISVLGLGGAVLVWAVALLCLAGLSASCVIFFHRVVEKLPFCGRLMAWGDRVSHGMVCRLTAATDVYAKAWRELGLLVVVSVFFVHLITVLPLGFLLAGMDVHFSVFTLVAAVTLGNIAGLIPLFPSGVGGRDLVIVTILAVAGMAKAPADAAQVMYTGIIIFFNLVGGIFFLCDPGRREVGKILAAKADEA